uniref:tRNA-5-taurinomethyluridine 2-sulfurtransferase n=1 Tax=Megaselia scalaris TaxID=36166 RepID=T1H646_MEGSC
MKNWDKDETGQCLGEKEYSDAEYVCRKLEIPLFKVNFVKDYWNNVFSEFLDDYKSGLTPNPDILCNKHIKFNAFYEYAKKNIKDAISTGHYARTSFGPFLENYDRGMDSFKDQTFFLSGIRQDVLQRTMFPLGEYLKKDVKDIAIKIGIPKLAVKKESTGICFIGKRNFQNFIQEYIPSKPGNFIDIDTKKIVGEHNGIHTWTIGQRCRIHSLNPYYVAKKVPETGDIYVASDEPSIILEQHISGECFMDFRKLNCVNFRCFFRFQHTKPLVSCFLQSVPDSNQIVVTLDKPLRAITPGQYSVFYNGEECLGS